MRKGFRRVTPVRSSRRCSSARDRQRKVPFLGWVAAYYVALFVFFALFLHPWMVDFAGRPMPGPWRTVGAALLLLSYLLMASLPALEWTRRGFSSSSLSRGVEAYLIFAAVSLAGWVLARTLGSEVSLQSALGLLEGFPWFIAGSAILFLGFIIFSYLGSRMSPGRGRRRRSGGHGAG